MTSSFILFAFFFILFLNCSIELILDVLNIRYVQHRSSEVPEFFGDYIDEETYTKSTLYTLTKAKFGIFHFLYGIALLLAFVLLDWFGVLDSWVRGFEFGMEVTGIVYFLVLSLLFSLLDIPFTLYSTFVIEERFGFNKMTFSLWLKDFIKGLLLSAVILSPVLYGLFWFMDSAGELWWLYAFCFIAVIQLVLMYLFPVFIAPLFNKFTPLEEGSLKAKIYALAEKIGFATSGIFVMDGSKRSSHGNAYFTGFGKNKRIVLFDTLLENLSEPQALAVLAHEMGHEQKGHVKKMLLLSLVTMCIGFWILSLCVDYLPFYEAFGFKEESYYAALVIFSFASSPFTYFLSPLFSIFSRKHEYEADRFAVDAVGGSKDLSDALLALSKKSLSNLTPHPWYSFFHYSHPTLYERIKAMQAYGEEVSC